jgi:hypothetical protein
VFDLIHFWDPQDFTGHTIDYDEVTTWIYENVVKRFQPVQLTFDQFNSVASVQAMSKMVRGGHFQKNIQVYERTATAQLNWATMETAKAAINMGLVHAPFHAEAADELKFLQKPPGQSKVICPDSGPVITKDIADCIVILADRLLGEQMGAFIATDLARQRPGGAMQGGADPFDRFNPETSLNPYSHAMGSLQGRGALARGMRPGMPGRQGAPRKGGAAAMRRHRS